jgi:uncharacterized RDD family membrane protein YckC
MSDTFNPYQPPAAGDDPESARARDEPSNLATRTQRFWAATIDGLIGMVLIVPLQFAFHVYDGFPKAQPLSIRQDIAWAVLGIFFYLAVHGYWLVKSAQTVGKKLLGLQVVNFSDGVPTPGSKIVLARVFPVTIVAHIPRIGIVLALLDPLFIFGKNRRCLHDLVAGTKVVKLRSSLEPRTDRNQPVDGLPV